MCQRWIKLALKQTLSLLLFSFWAGDIIISLDIALDREETCVKLIKLPCWLLDIPVHINVCHLRLILRVSLKQVYFLQPRISIIRWDSTQASKWILSSICPCRQIHKTKDWLTPSCLAPTISIMAEEWPNRKVLSREIKPTRLAPFSKQGVSF